MKPLCYRGSKEIAAAVGINHNNFPYYVKELGLPAFQIEGRGPYVALQRDLVKWLETQRKKSLSSPF